MTVERIKSIELHGIDGVMTLSREAFDKSELVTAESLSNCTTVDARELTVHFGEHYRGIVNKVIVNYEA